MKFNLRTILELLAFTILYVAAGKLGLSMAPFNASASPIFPATGLALGVLLLRGYRLWPAVFLGAFIVNITTPHASGIGIVAWSLSSTAIALGNTLEALLGTLFTRRLARGMAFIQKAPDVLRFAFFAAIPSTALAATLGATSLCCVGAAHWEDYLPVWVTWWTGDYVSDLLVAPLIIIWLGVPRPEMNLKRWLEVLVLTILTAVVCWITFGKRTPSVSAVSNLLLPLLLWAAFRFQQWGAAVSAGLMSVIAIQGTLQSTGPFVMYDASVNESLLLVQAFVGFRILTALVVGAVVAERIGVQKEKEQALASERLARSEAERANRAKDDFLAILSHELRTPLTPVMLTASLLESDAQLPEHFRADMRTIRQNVELEARLIDDLLDVTRIARGKLTLSLEDVDIHQVIRRAADICCADRTHDLTLALDAQRHHVRGDAGRLQQIFWNLLSNAVKFTPSGRQISVHSSNPDASSVRIVVCDAGIGIDPELVPRLFIAFVQGQASAIRKPGGLGLGLTITRALIDAHGGTVVARSPGKDQGAEFTIEIATLDAPLRQTSAPAPLNGSPTSSLGVLLVEDHEPTMRVMSRLLESLGHRVTNAGSVAAALEAAQNASFDLVISDIGLPDASGCDLMRRLRSSLAQRGIAVKGIAVSGFGMEDDIRLSREAGFHVHLTKPVDLQRLQAAIRRAVVESDPLSPLPPAASSKV